MQNIQPLERDLTLSEAKQRIEADFAALKLLSHSETVGKRVVATLTTLESLETGRCTIGGGKGYAEYAFVGSLYEALEHYLSDDHRVELGIEYQHAAHFTRTGYFADDSILDIVTRQSDKTIACRRYSCPISHQTFLYPVALSSPVYPDKPFAKDSFDYRALRRYSSNNGMAIGANYNEAVIHASNEYIERDAISLFLLTHFYYQCGLSLRRVKRPNFSTSPFKQATDDIAMLWQEVEKELNVEVVVVDISTEFIVKTYLAFAKTTYSHPHLFGAGASIDAGYAIRRALNELVQVHLVAVYKAEAKKALLNAMRHLSLFPRLQRCLQFNIAYLLDQVPYRVVELPKVGKLPALPEQIRLLADDMRRHGRILGVATPYVTELGTTLVNVVIPGLERFFVVSSGNIVIPSERGRSYIRKIMNG